MCHRERAYHPKVHIGFEGVESADFYGWSWEKNQTISEIPVPISIDRKKMEFENLT